MLFESLPITHSGRVPDLSLDLADATELPVSGGAIRIKRLQLTEGVRAGVQVLLVETDRVRAAICPTRGMGLWQAHIDGMQCGWKSPVQGPVHPNFVAVDESSGIGWLDGFDELLVRCGIRNFGAPEFDTAGGVAHPLHGRVANLPAENVTIQVDADQASLVVTGDVYERRVLQYNLKLQASYRFQLGSNVVEVNDQVTNLAGTDSSMQLLYHINVGRPFLQEGSSFDTAATRAVARDARAAEGIADWNRYAGPQPGYAEQVYFYQPTADTDGWATSLLTDASNSHAFAVHQQTGTLPCFSQWKNTVAEADGYVTGLEPGTSFPNVRSFEETQGRVVPLAAGESVQFNLRLEAMSDRSHIQQTQEAIAGSRDGKMQMDEFDSNWCVAR